ncbi:hypothetical protein DE146DRAFT_758943 [Phaeosphaeria sp. MPI-PUGE-AT-0046c]|nr:hypothetical protein DE146DRAFT_758943 [Phaeosphaeria sp. MPI-PUGE-AT-0046c]
MPTSMQPSKDSRATTSCSECQRRKQRFGVKKAQQDSPPDSIREPSSEGRGQKRSFQETTEALLSEPDDEGDLEDGLKAWGYMPGHVHFKVGTTEDGSPKKDSPADTASSEAVDKILHAIPPRSITDSFVNHFLSVINYRYCAIYGPTLTNQYVEWWTDRAAGRRLSPEFTCLLLRICAYSVQYLSPAMRNMIEFELACDSQVLTDRFSSAAEQLSQSFEASNTTLERVQEQFLKGVWLKSESRIVDSWHALGCTIREAQELGIDKDAGIEDLSEFEIEIRRRIWTLLYIWDWQMSAWLGRPNLIDQKNLTFKFPNLRLDQSTVEPNLLSPFAHMALQAHLGRRVATVLGDAGSVHELSAKEVSTVEAECEKYIKELPPVFRVNDPDTSFDEQHPYFVFQRHQLHCVIYVTMLDFLKPYLTRDRRDNLTERDDEFRKMGVDIAMRLLRVSRKLFDHEFPINAKFHLVVFSIFDTATLLCSAIIHDRDHILPHRQEVFSFIEASLDMLHQLSAITKLGASSYRFLHKLVQASPELNRNACSGKRQKNKALSASTSKSECFVPSGLVSHIPTLEAAVMSTVPVTPVPAPDNISFDLDQFLANNDLFSDLVAPGTFDLGGMEQIWDWENLHLDGAPLSEGPTREDP